MMRWLVSRSVGRCLVSAFRVGGAPTSEKKHGEYGHYGTGELKILTPYEQETEVACKGRKRGR
jgi:hypothetical protein